jgi:ABC-type transport system involved in multi-copper enzyme maturation permease subunit
MTTTAPSPVRSIRPVRTGRPRSLTRIELRKTVDTRSGRWLLVAIAVTGLAAALISAIAGDAKDHGFDSISSAVQGSMAVLLPIVSILLVTSEWSQRTALQTFVLTPARGRIVRAKLLAGSLIAVLGSLVGAGLAAAAAATAGSHPADGTWRHAGAVLLGSVIVQLISQLMAMGFALLLLSSPGAIVANFAIPLAWAALTGGVRALHGVQPWVDSSKVSTNLLSGDMDGTRWAQVVVVTLVWVVALLAAGSLRLRRHEIA